MEYRLKIGDDIVLLDVEVQAGGLARLLVDGKQFEARFSRVSDHHLFLAIQGPGGAAGVNAFVADGPEGKTVLINGTPYLVLDQDRADLKKPRKGGPVSGPTEVTPPTPAVVARILVSGGERVAKGQGLIVVSAMKMETTLGAPFSGTVKKINVAAGDKVLPGQVLVDIEKDPEKQEETPSAGTDPEARGK